MLLQPRIMGCSLKRTFCCYLLFSKRKKDGLAQEDWCGVQLLTANSVTMCLIELLVCAVCFILEVEIGAAVLK